MNVTAFFQDIKSEIIRNLNTATKEIKVAVAWLTDEDIIRTLIQKSEEKVDVTIVISDAKENFRNVRKLKQLVRSGAKIFVTSPKFLHHKFCIIDDHILINGSYNWTYFAQKNEENILVISTDKSSAQDILLFSKFNSKHRFFCEKISSAITNTSDLDHYREAGKNIIQILTQLDEAEIELRQELEDDVKKSFDEALSIKIPISPLLLERMQLDGGGVKFIKRILYDEMHDGEMKSGFKKLEKPIPHRVNLSLEYLVSRPKYQPLFSEEEIEFCKKQMAKYEL